MDPFTQKMLEKTKLRREKLDEHFSKELGLGLRQPLTEKKSFNSLAHSNQIKGDYVNPKSSYQSVNIDNPNVENAVSCEQMNKSESIEETIYCADKKDCHKKRPCKFGRLAELATKIKEWEDELNTPKQCAQSSAVSNSESVNKSIEKSARPIKSFTGENKAEKQLIWDTAIIKSLESQGYALSKNESRLTYDFENVKKTAESTAPRTASTVSNTSIVKQCINPGYCKTEVETKHDCGISPRKNNEKDSVVLKKAAFFESQNRSSPNKVEKDPIELSISERKALFEKIGGEVLLPKVAFATPLPAKLAVVNKSHKFTEKLKDKMSHPIRNINKAEGRIDNPELGVKQSVARIDESEKENAAMKKKEKFEETINTSPRSPSTCGLMDSHEKELEFLEIRCDNKKVSKREISLVPEPPQTPIASVVSPSKNSNIQVCEEVNAEEGTRLYPSLREFEEPDESDRPTNDPDSLNGSKNSNIYLNMSFSDILKAKKDDPSSSNENSFSADLGESQVLSKMDEFLDKALNDLSSADDFGSEDDGSDAPSPPKMLKSCSFEYKGKNEESLVNSLVHTVSFYRKQQQSSINPQSSDLVKSIKRVEDRPENVTVEKEEILVENKIQELLQEINKQQTIISQASQALSLCLSTVEFSNSGEQVESERLLLLANHKRQACLNEIQRLKIENTIYPRGSNQLITEKGDVIISNICVPLKRDALRAMAAVESMQYFVCLIKSDERVIATPAVPATRDNMKSMSLCFPGQYKLEKLLSNFKVTIEVYNLELSKEMLPHEVKYHIVNKKDKKLLTPIKSKKTESKLVMPCIQSPAGPNAVRSSNFHLSGYLVFSLREVGRTNWTLNKVPYTCPVEGTFSMQIKSQLQLDTEFKGFLTMFDDISGFGAWHRRWCLLSSHTLSYWKYPDDEARKVPIGTIDLRGVVTENVGVVSRDICARLYTFLLETTRPRHEHDKESLVLNVQGDITKIRHLLSADSKEEMLIWCRKLNSTLALLRSWRCSFDV